MRWLLYVVLIIVIASVGVGIASIFKSPPPADSPWEQMPPPITHVDHTKFIPDELTSGPQVTRTCLKCHPNAAKEVMKTSHWTWEGHKVKVGAPGHERTIKIGKKNLINNFCIAAGLNKNIQGCSSCHAGYGWKDNNFDFTKEDSVDCLVCHDQTNTYQKGHAGLPKFEVDLVKVARSVGSVKRNNCGQCHFKGGGGDAVKHGDLDGTMYHPAKRIDVHMGKLNFECTTCHQAKHHEIPGRSMSVNVENTNRVNCTDCHNEKPHGNDRLDAHTRTVACQTCHIPRMAIDAPTKMYWDWSTTGDDSRKEDPFVYQKKKGSFEYAQNIRPEYYWYNGMATRYITGDPFDPTKVLDINKPLGSVDDPKAKIWPFKVHRGKQIYDKKLLYLIPPRTESSGGYWRDFDWDKACRLGCEDAGLPYSGTYDFAETAMYWPLSHMVQEKGKALQCIECHGENGIMDWKRLGYGDDPMFRGDRRRTELIKGKRGESR